MQTHDLPLTELCEQACQAAHGAGQIIRAAAAGPVKVQHKEAAESLASQVVTEIDLQCDAFIRAELASSIARYDLALLTEECEDDGQRLQKEYFWCVDPLDGTLAFTRGQAGYAVAIGLLTQSGEALLGVVYDPWHDTLYSAIRGQGAFRDGVPWQRGSDSSSLLTLPLDDGLQKRDDFQQLIVALERGVLSLGLEGCEYRYHGGSIMSALWVAASAIGCYFKLPKPAAGGGSSWDFAATACICAELGVTMEQFYGGPLDLNRAESTYMNTQGVIVCTDQRLATLLRQGLPAGI